MAKLAEDLPGHQHCPGGDGPDFCLSTSTHPSQHHVLHQEQLPGSPAGRQCPAIQGSHRESSERVFSWVLKPAVPGAEEDMGSASSHRFVYFESAPGGAALHDGDSGVRSRRRQERMDCLHRHKRSLWRQKVLTIQGQQEDLPIHLSTLRIGNFTSRIYQASKASRSLVEAARCRATRLLLADPCRVTKTGPTACRDDHHSIPAARMGHQFREVGPNTQPGLPIPWNAVQHSTVHIGAPAENASQDPVGSTALDDEPCHPGIVVFMALLVRRGRLRLWPVQWWATTAWCQRTGNWSDRITVPQWVLQEVAWWASPAVLQGRPLATQETEVTFFTDASNSGWGAQLGSCSIQGQWSASQRSSHIHILEMQAIIKLQNGYPFQVLHTALHPLESSHQGHHEKPYMDRGDC